MITGQIQVAGHQILRYSAKRERTGVNGYIIYRVECSGHTTSPLGTILRNKYDYTFEIPHNPEDGMLALVGSILVEIENSHADFE